MTYSRIRLRRRSGSAAVACPVAVCFAAWIVLAATLATCSAQTAQPWSDADRLFHSDPRWLGSDAAFSIDLGNGRVLWMFNDTFVARKLGDTRRQAAFIHSSVAIQTGYDPSHASLNFFWNTLNGNPSEIFQDEGDVWLWPTSGVRDGDTLLLFSSRITHDSSPNSLGFKVIGWNAYRVTNPDAPPSAWHMTRIAAVNDNVILASQALTQEGFIYLFGHGEPQHSLYLARIRSGQRSASKLEPMQWWTGDGWDSSSARRQPVITEAGTETSIQRDPHGSGYIEINSRGFGATDIVMRESPTLTGPWSKPAVVYRPPESDQPQAFVYAGKSHSELRGADLVLTYASNGPYEKVAADMHLYFPRFVKVSLPPRETTVGH